ncbi:hypothetical protein B0H13DRAFT_1914365 [Mycena leptocephala]|nr:hypothetical protein B0H13DRAFT_1914365 [Mycena leptocephala]
MASLSSPQPESWATDILSVWENIDIAWRLSAEAGKVIKTGRNDTRWEKMRTVVQRAHQSAGGKWEGVEGKKEAFQSPKSNDAPMTQSHGDVEQRRALVRNCQKTVEACRAGFLTGDKP